MGKILTKICTKCKKEKSVDEFSKDKHKKDGLCCLCRQCSKIKSAKYNKINREKILTHNKRYYQENRKKILICSRTYYKNHRRQYRNARFKREFGITLIQYDAMLEKQHGVCKICGKPESRLGNGGNVKKLAIDHDHKTGKIRGLLCGDCNRGMGFVDDKNFIKKAVKYKNAV